MKTDCPAPADLLLFALETGPSSTVLERHMTSCAACRRELNRLGEALTALRSSAKNVSVSSACLDEAAIAEVVDGFEPLAQPELTAHLVVCAHCRNQVASVARVLRSAPVAAEVRRIERTTARPHVRWRNIAIAGTAAGLMAAGLAGVMLWPTGARNAPTDLTNRGVEVYREGTITTTAAPRAVAPIGEVAGADTLLWTAVPLANRYRVTVFDRDGAVILDTQVSDTTLAFPETLQRASGGLYLWKVEARTGWDRWVSSELVEFTLRSPRSGR